MKRRWMILHHKRVWLTLEFQGYLWNRKQARWQPQWKLMCICSSKEEAQQHIACLRAA